MAKDTPVQSPLLQAFNTIVKVDRSRAAINNSKREYTDFLRFMTTETRNLGSIRLPKEKKIKELKTLNIATTFGRPGSLLSGLFSGALDLGGFLGDMFSNKKPNPKAGKPIPKGKGIRLGGVKAYGIANALFAGLDFATGLAEGESVSKAAAGAGGSLAGSLLGGAIGQTLIPVPGLGFMVGSALGGMAGGWLGDRAHEGITGEGSVEQKTKQRLKEQEAKQKSQAEAVTSLSFPQVLDTFEGVVFKFQRLAYGSINGVVKAAEVATEDGEKTHAEIDPRKPGSPSGDDPVNNKYMAEGGEKPSKYVNTVDYNEFRQYYNSGKGGRHAGEDLPISQGTPISVIVPGKVVTAGYGGAAGGNILITHEDGKQTRYLHMSDISVSPGQKVEAGQVIGKSGGAPGTRGAGRSTGPHLHFEYYPSETAAMADPNPVMDNYFRFGGNVKVTSKGPATPPAGQPTATPPPPKKLTEDEFHSVRTERDITDTADIRVGSTDTYEDYLKYFEENKAQIAAAAVSTVEPGTSTPEVPTTTTPSRRPDRRSQAAARRRESQLQPQVEADPQPQVEAAPQQQVMTKELEQYPSYNTSSSEVVVIPMMMNSGPQSSSQKPIVISNGGQSKTITPPRVSERSLLNSLFNTMLLTNLSGT